MDKYLFPNEPKNILGRVLCNPFSSDFSIIDKLLYTVFLNIF